MNKVKVLFLAANPLDSTRLSLDEEARAIERKLRSSKYRESIVLKTWWAVQPDDLLQALNEELPQVVHFSGHGMGHDGLVFHDETGNTRLVTGTALKRLFNVFRGNIRVVILNSCYSHTQARAIVNCVDCVIGMNNSISDKAAHKFAVSFYRAIAFGHSVQNAFEQGLASIALESLGQEDFPTLLVRESINPNDVFLIKAGQLESNTCQPELSEGELQHITKKVPNKRMQKAYGDRFLRNDLPGMATKIRHKEALSIILIDIDELTIINKQYGRKVGNNVIAAIAHILFNESGTEHNGRCGDDTYYVILPGYDINKAEHVALYLSKCVKEQPWGSLASDLRVTCTFGVSQLQKHEPIQDWVIRAAVAVNDAKRGGISGKIGGVEETEKKDKKAAEEAMKWAKGAEKRRKVALAPLYLSKNQSRELRDYYS